jgi:hypothetical protein
VAAKPSRKQPRSVSRSQRQSAPDQIAAMANLTVLHVVL